MPFLDVETHLWLEVPPLWKPPVWQPLMHHWNYLGKRSERFGGKFRKPIGKREKHRKTMGKWRFYLPVVTNSLLLKIAIEIVCFPKKNGDLNHIYWFNRELPKQFTSSMKGYVKYSTLWLLKITMENCPLIDDLCKKVKMVFFHSIAILRSQRVTCWFCRWISDMNFAFLHRFEDC